MDVLKCVNDRRPVGMNSAGNGGMALQYGTVSQPLVWPLNFSPFFFFFWRSERICVIPKGFLSASWGLDVVHVLVAGGSSSALLWGWPEFVVLVEMPLVI